MNIDKDQILQLLRSQGKDDQASQASSELPDRVDTGNAQHPGCSPSTALIPATSATSSAVWASSSDRPSGR